MIADDFEKSPVVAWIFDCAGEQRFRETLNRGERRLEFVRDVGDKILPHALQSAQFGDVVKHNDRAGRFLRG